MPDPTQRADSVYDAFAATYDETYSDVLCRAEDRWLSWVLRQRLYDLASRPHPLRVLDLGCGTGWFVDQVLCDTRLPAVSYVGLDASEPMLWRARTKYPTRMVGKHRVQFQRADFNDELPVSGFDLVVSTYCTPSYASSIEGFTARVYDALLPGGSAYLMPWAAGVRRRREPADEILVDKPFWLREEAEAAMEEAGFHRIFVGGLRHPRRCPPGASLAVHLGWLAAERAAYSLVPDRLCYLTIEGVR